MKKENTDIQNIAHQININQQVYDELPEETFEAHILRMIQRLKMQKKLFIKEITNATQIATSELVASKNSDDNPSASSILDNPRGQPQDLGANPDPGPIGGNPIDLKP